MEMEYLVALGSVIAVVCIYFWVVRAKPKPLD